MTWNWGYQDTTQVVGDTLEFRGVQTTGPTSINGADDDPQPGLELTYQRVMGNLGRNQQARWGIEVAFSYTDLDITAGNSLVTGTSQITDVYTVPTGGIPPFAPYAGSFAGPGMLLGDSPTRTSIVSDAQFTSSHKLSGEMFGIRLGPFVEWSPNSCWTLGFSGGLALAPTSLEYRFTETTTPTGGAPATLSGSDSTTELLYGAYLSALVDYAINEQWGVFASAQFQTLNDLEQSAAGHTAELDAGSTFFGVLGLRYRF